MLSHIENRVKPVTGHRIRNVQNTERIINNIQQNTKLRPLSVILHKRFWVFL